MYDKAEVRQIAHRFADLVRQEYAPHQIILFGSYVNGTPHEDSDIDIAVIFRDFQGDWFGTWGRLCGIKYNVTSDIEPHLMDETDDPIGFVEHIMQTGEIIYRNEE